MGGESRRVLQFEGVGRPLSILSPKTRKKKYSNARSFAKAAQDDTLSVILNVAKNLAFKGFWVEY